jgi:hypothetical protein
MLPRPAAYPRAAADRAPRRSPRAARSEGFEPQPSGSAVRYRTVRSRCGKQTTVRRSSSTTIDVHALGCQFGCHESAVERRRSSERAWVNATGTRPGRPSRSFCRCTAWFPGRRYLCRSIVAHRVRCRRPVQAYRRRLMHCARVATPNVTQSIIWPRCRRRRPRRRCVLAPPAASTSRPSMPSSQHPTPPTLGPRCCRNSRDGFDRSTHAHPGADSPSALSGHRACGPR